MQGYFPDVGASYYLSRLDGEVGTYLALTGNSIKGREVLYVIRAVEAFESDITVSSNSGLATHYIPSRRVPDVMQRLASLQKVTLPLINDAIEEFYQEPHSGEQPMLIQGDIRRLLDRAFGCSSVEDIMRALDQAQARGGKTGAWAKATLNDLQMRSPTSLCVALEAVRRGKHLRTLADALKMELAIATAYCVSSNS